MPMSNHFNAMINSKSKVGSADINQITMALIDKPRHVGVLIIGKDVIIVAEVKRLITYYTYIEPNSHV